MPGYKKLKNVDPNCFACGPDNQHGLKMTFESNGTKLRSFVKIPSYMRGWSNLVHGGILSTICDEIMSWAAIHLTGRFILTRDLAVSYLKPVTLDQELEVTGYIKERTDKRNAVVCAEIRNEKGELCTTGQGNFALFSAENFRKFNIIPDELIDEMLSVIDTIQ